LREWTGHRPVATTFVKSLWGVAMNLTFLGTRGEIHYGKDLRNGDRTGH
jgi:hypothetical protein